MTASQLARELGTSVPRVVRAAQRLGFDRRAGRGPLVLSEAQAKRLRSALGSHSVAPGLSATETRALAALARSPLGLGSARAVARKAGLSPTATSRALARLAEAGLVTHEDAVIVAGRPRHVRLLHANRRNPAYRALAPVLAQVRPPEVARDEEVPVSLRHLFWNTNPDQLNVAHGGEYIARRLLRTLDLAGLAWGASNLEPAHWRAAAQARGLDLAVKALAENLAVAEGGLTGRRLRAEATKVESFHADAAGQQHPLGSSSSVGDVPVADIRDLMAMKLKVLSERGELRDYYDVKEIEERAGVSLEDGIALFRDRYGLDQASSAIRQLIMALGYLDDCDEDESLPMSKSELTEWWRKRHAKLIRNLSR